MRNIKLSVKCGVKIWRPMGKPAGEAPHGTLMQGTPERLPVSV
jgi:hypothetical protein